MNRSRTDRRPDVLLKRPDGESWNRSFSIQCRDPDRRSTSSGRMMLDCLASERDYTSSGRMEQWTDGRPEGMARSSGRLIGNFNIF